MQQLQIFTTTTKNIKVIAQPLFIPDQSIIPQSLYFWSYSIYIENMNDVPVQLLSRSWKIIDANGDITEVQGPGVVGQKPIIGPSERYQYTSGTYLKTPSGMMLGTYTMKVPNNEGEFDIAIPTFSLDSPYEFHKPA